MLVMAPPSLDTLDLSKLVALEALLRHQSVSAAARELGLSQPTLSQLLARLRLLFGDPLLLRSENRMVPSAKGTALHAPLVAAIAGVRRLGDEAIFDPRTAVARVRVACTDFIAGLLLPTVIQELRREAPGIHIELQNWGTRRAEALAGEQLDLGIGSGSRSLSGIYQRKLFDDEFVCIADKKNRSVHRRWTPSEFAALPHAQLSVKGSGFSTVDTTLAQLGLSRTIALSLPHFWLAGEMVLGTDLVTTVPKRLGLELVRRLPGLRWVRPPMPVPGFTAALLWHERRHADPVHQWLRQNLAQAAKQVGRG